MSFNKRLFIGGAGAYQATGNFQDNIASYNSSSTQSAAGDLTAELNANLTGNDIWVDSADSSKAVSMGNNGSSRINNQIIMTMKGPITTNSFTSKDFKSSYYNYTGTMKWYGSNNGTSWTELASNAHTGGSLNFSSSSLTTNYTASTWSYYKVDFNAGTRGTYGNFMLLNIGIVL